MANGLTSRIIELNKIQDSTLVIPRSGLASNLVAIVHESIHGEIISQVFLQLNDSKKNSKTSESLGIFRPREEVKISINKLIPGLDRAVKFTARIRRADADKLQKQTLKAFAENDMNSLLHLDGLDLAKNHSAYTRPIKPILDWTEDIELRKVSTKADEPLIYPEEINLITDACFAVAQTDDQGNVKIASETLFKLDSGRIMVEKKPLSGQQVEIKDFFLYMDELLKNTDWKSSRIIENPTHRNPSLDSQYIRFIRKNGLLDEVNLDGDKRLKSVKKYLQKDYVCAWNILNCGGCPTGRPPIHGQTYWDRFPGNPIIYQDPNFQDKPLDKLHIITGIDRHVVHDPTGETALSSEFFDTRKTVLWQPFKIYSANSDGHLNFTTPHMPGNYTGVMEWFNSDGQATYKSFYFTVKD